LGKWGKTATEFQVQQAGVEKRRDGEGFNPTIKRPAGAEATKASSSGFSIRDASGSRVGNKAKDNTPKQNRGTHVWEKR